MKAKDKLLTLVEMVGMKKWEVRDAQAEISFKAGYEQAEIDRFRGHMIEAELQGDCQQEI